MRLSPRRRIVLLLMIASLVGYYYVTWALVIGRNIVRHYRYGMVVCSNSWRDFGNGSCGSFPFTSFSPFLAWLELLVVSALLIVLGWLLARWALRPVRAMADTVGRLGPTSLGLRLAASGILQPLGCDTELKLVRE